MEKILCPVDPSVDSGRALRYAAVLAHSYGARLVALTCVGDARGEERREAEDALRRAVLCGYTGPTATPRPDAAARKLL